MAMPTLLPVRRTWHAERSAGTASARPAPVAATSTVARLLRRGRLGRLGLPDDHDAVLFEELLDQGHAPRSAGCLVTVTAAAVESGALVLATTGLEAEAELAFASLHQLLRPILATADRRPARQRSALLCAFGMEDDTPTEQFLVGLAVLTQLAELSEERPVLAVIDDAPWLDQSSLDASGLPCAGSTLSPSPS
jgi:hypothetical protein